MNLLELRSIASVDSLTGVLSRRAFRDAFARARSESVRTDRPNACIMFDLDHFKSVNDRHGHGIGDVVLAETAAACSRELVPGQAMGRLGGEEFAVLLPSAGRDEALAVAERLRRAITGVRIVAHGGVLSVTGSFGVASMPGRDGSFDAMMSKADDALYSAKAAGRNRCMAWGVPDVVELLEVA